MPADAKNMKFEDALNELEGIVRSLESGKTSLEDSVAAYERGMELRAVCETRLKEAQLKVNKVSNDATGQPVLTPLDPETLTEKK